MSVSVIKYVLRSFQLKQRDTAAAVSHLQGLPHWGPDVNHMAGFDDSFG